MALEQITQAVLDAAHKEADLIIKSAEKTVADKLAAARKVAEQDTERRYQAATRAIEDELAQKIIQLQGTANKELLEKKNGLLRQVFQQAKEKILTLPEAEYAAIMQRLLGSAGIDCAGKLRVHSSENAIFETIVAGFNAGNPQEVQVSLDMEQPLGERGGFIFVSDSFEIDQTLATLLANVEHEMAPQISAELFAAQE